MIKKYIKMIVENGKKEDMEELSDMLEEVIYYIKETDKNKYEHYKYKLIGMAYDYHFNEELAKKIVDNMSEGELWDIATIETVMKNYNVNEDVYEFYVVMNSLANDYGNVISIDNVELYVNLAKAFINDKDAKEHKVWIYFMNIPNNI